MASNQYHQRSDDSHQRLNLDGIPRELMHEVKAIAYRRGITLKQLIVEALQRLIVEARER